MASVGIAALLSAGAAIAQVSTPAAEDQTVEEVVVVGVRASLARAVALKRDATTVQDSISALELGMFPDDNVADSLSHITGVSISRTAGGEEPEGQRARPGPGVHAVHLQRPHPGHRRGGTRLRL